MARKLILAAIVTILCLASLPGIGLAAGPRYTPGAEGLGDPYFPGDGNGGYDVRHYDLAVKYDPETDRLTGVATIRARATQNLSKFNLDFVGLRLREVRVNGDRARTQRDGQELTITPRRGLPKGRTFTVVAKYDGIPKSLEEFGLSGFIHTNDGAIAIGEPHVAATWFPANDHPRDKASFTIAITVPAGLEAMSNGVLKSHRTRGDWTTWTWDAREPMTTYLAFMSVGEFDVRAYREDGIRYWDAIDSAFMADQAPPVVAEDGAQFLYSQMADLSYKRLTHVIDVPSGGADVSFRVNRDTEQDFDHLFVEVHTVGLDDWTTLPDVSGHTSQDVGACPGHDFDNPFLLHYLSHVLIDPGDPGTEEDDLYGCDPVGTTGEWHAADGQSAGWEDWHVEVPDADGSPRQVELSITFASDFSVQFRGVALDSVVVSTGQGTTSFEDDGNELDGWDAPIERPDSIPGDPEHPDNLNTWVTTDFLPATPGLGVSALLSFDRQPEIIAWEASQFGRYPFSAAGGIVDDAFVGFALENQTRPTYSPFFFGGGQGDDFVVVHELAHQWFGDSVALDAWQHIWLNEGFATYAEWLWSEREGLGTAQENFDGLYSIPDEDEFSFWDLPIGDPGPNSLFDFQIYGRGAMTLHALRLAVGDHDFFRILKTWTRKYAGGNVTTDQFIALSERISGEDLGDLFGVWLGPGKPAGYDLLRTSARTRESAEWSVNRLPAAVRSLAVRYAEKPGQPFEIPNAKIPGKLP